ITNWGDGIVISASNDVVENSMITSGYDQQRLVADGGSCDPAHPTAPGSCQPINGLSIDAGVSNTTVTGNTIDESNQAIGQAGEPFYVASALIFNGAPGVGHDSITVTNNFIEGPGPTCWKGGYSSGELPSTNFDVEGNAFATYDQQEVSGGYGTIDGN